MNFDDFVKIALRDIRVSYRDAFNEWACADGNKMIEYLEKANNQTEALIRYLKEQIEQGRVHG